MHLMTWRALFMSPYPRVPQHLPARQQAAVHLLHASALSVQPVCQGLTLVHCSAHLELGLSLKSPNLNPL
jgi:hypothetical protein